MANERLDRFTKLLKEIFELDKSDLDFGIYRVMNLRKTQMGEYKSNLPSPRQATLGRWEIATASLRTGFAMTHKGRQMSCLPSTSVGTGLPDGPYGRYYNLK